MADNWVESTDRELRRWADERGEKLDEQGTRILLELMQDELGLPGPGELTPERLRKLLLEVFPDAVVASADDVPTVLAALRAIVGHLRDSGAVTAPDAAELDTEIDRAAPEFTEVIGAYDNAEQEAAAEVVAGLMQADGVSMEDREAVDAWLNEFENLPEDERFARTEEYLREVGEQVVPPVRIAPEAELAAAARASRLTGAVVELAEWTGERDLAEHGTLSDEDAQEARRALGLREQEADGDLETDSADELERLWWAAVAAEVIETDTGRAASGAGLAGLRSPDDAGLLAAWLPLFDAVAVPEHDYEDGLDAAELVQNAMTGVLIQLYEQEEPTGLDALVTAMIEHIGEQYELRHDDAAMEGLLTDAFMAELDVLRGWGVVAPAGDGGWALTPLAVWAVRELLVADGFLAPVVGDLADATAAELVSGLVLHRDDTADEEIGGWLARRDAVGAAAGLLDVMRTGGPGARNIAASVLQRVGADAVPAVRDAADHPLVAPYAALWLLSAGDAAGREPTRDEYLWMFVDTVAGMMEATAAAAAVVAALADVPPEADMTAMVDDLWRVRHPDLVEVLEALGDHHPDKAVAKTARTAAYKARSA